MHSTIDSVTEKIIQRSRASRQDYLERMQSAQENGPHRASLSCGNLAHGFAACSVADKVTLAGERKPNLAIVSAYNDMLSAHQPLAEYPQIIKRAAQEVDAVAQFAGGVPAMCDGVTQGQPGMELSLFSRDVIALSTAVALSHNMFDAACCLGVCDKIVPGLLIGALAFGHLPVIFIPAGPMTSGITNDEKARVRQQYAAGKIGRRELLESESRAYHSPGTCTFYGTANTNQLLLEFMGLHLPGVSFVNPGTPLRNALTAESTRRVLARTALGDDYMPLSNILDERAMVNAMVGLMASGGSTNLTIHLIAIAKAAGIEVNWDDFDAISSAVPLLARVYPNGKADVNHFQAAGGVQFMMRELADAGLLHTDVNTIVGHGLDDYFSEPALESKRLVWQPAPRNSLDDAVLRPCSEPFDENGGLRLLSGNVGRAVIKVSAVAPEHRIVEAPARVFSDQQAVVESFRRLELEQDVVIVLMQQGPRANGMPELHKLTPILGLLQDKGFKVALVTDGRMSGASGKIPAAIHVSPEAICGGVIGLIRDGDRVRLDADKGVLEVLVDESELKQREPLEYPRRESGFGMGRELFSNFRAVCSSAESGGSSL